MAEPLDHEQRLEWLSDRYLRALADAHDALERAAMAAGALVAEAKRRQPARMLNADQAAALLGCSAGKVREMAAAGVLPSFRIEGEWRGVRFRESDIEQYVAEHTQRGVGPAAVPDKSRASRF